MTNETESEYVDEVLQAIQQKRATLEKDVEQKRAALEEAEATLSAFRANALSALGAASGSKSAQKQRAERQAVVAQLLTQNLSRAEIVRRTGLPDHLVGYDIDCIRNRRRKQGQKKVFAEPLEEADQESSADDVEPVSEKPTAPTESSKSDMVSVSYAAELAGAGVHVVASQSCDEEVVDLYQDEGLTTVA
jgi:hypothetical protein